MTISLNHSNYIFSSGISYEEAIEQCTKKYPKFDVKLYRRPRTVLASFLNTDFMLHNHDKSVFEKALEIQIYSLGHYMMAVLPLKKSDNFLVKAVALRAFVENSANIVYMAMNRDDEGLPTRFLETTHATGDMLYAMKRGSPLLQSIGLLPK